MIGADTQAAEARPAGRIATAIQDLPPAAFAFVMATGIISVATDAFGPAWLSRALLAVATIGLVVLAGMLLARLVRYPANVAADARAPEKTFGFFTIVAGIEVVGVRFDAAGHPMVTAVLAMLAAALWLGLTYGLPADLLLAREKDSVLGGVNGTWLLWVVGTQSLAITAAALVKAWPAQAGLLAPAAAALWGIGLVLYLLLVSLILLRWLTVPMTPAALGPPYWILMGATAITVRAGAGLLALPAALPIRTTTGPFVSGFSFVLWSFGTWWIPLLIILGLWRHLGHHWPLTYETALWSVVFPLGMYSVATLAYGKATKLAFMTTIAHIMLWVAIIAWAAVTAAGLIALAARPHAPARPAGVISST